MMISKMKPCSTCKLTLNLDNFHKSSDGKCGVRAACKTCTKTYQKGRKETISEYSKARYKVNKDRHREMCKSWRDNNKDRHDEMRKNWNRSNKEKISEYGKARYEMNKEIINERCKKWKVKNLHLLRSYGAKRRSTKLNATPTWLSRLELEQIKSLYKEAVDLEKLTGIPHHVDHSIPLIHPLVCGFHCLSNLRVITAKENLQKGNKFIPFVESDLDTTINLNTCI